MRLLLMRVVERNKHRGLLPASAEARVELDKLKVDERVWVKVDRSRSLPQQRLFWKVLQVVGRSTSYETGDRLLVALKIRLAKFDVAHVPGREDPIPVLRSTSFSEMKRDEFNEFFKNSMEIICGEVLGGYDQEQLLSEVASMLDGQTLEPSAAA